MARGDHDEKPAGGPPPRPSLARALSARSLGPTAGQSIVLVGGGVAAAALAALQPVVAGAILVGSVQVAFVACAAWRILLTIASLRPTVEAPQPSDWSRYTIIAALHDEAAVTAQLIGRLSRVDYPVDRLEGFLVLEAHDRATIKAAEATPRPDWLHILIAPPGQPRTKPRALNLALAEATGDLVTVYDAEDEPDPQQLREAAARFAADASGRLACLQAPLRIRTGPRARFLDRQFAAEYAALFEVVLPGMTRLGLPFPLGGTSNHFRVDALRAVGGWDAWNVTEDADLGFRLWRRGWRLGMLSRPTLESPPGPVEQWLPQRTRWLKGYMQTWGVHTRRPWRLGARGLLALVMTLGAGLASAAAHGPSVAWFVTAVIVALDAGLAPMTPWPSLAVMIVGASAAWLTCAIGSRRAGAPYSAADMILAPAYWSMLSLAFGHAVWRLVREPFAWDKTAHRPDGEGE